MQNQGSFMLSIELPFSATEWELLSRLPRRVLVASISAEPDRGLHTVDEGVAGIEAIAAGRISDSALVRQVAHEIFTEHEATHEATGKDPCAAQEFVDRVAGIRAVLAECRDAARLLNDRVPADDAHAYVVWLIGLATSVCAAARTDGEIGLGGVRISQSEREFLDMLWRALTTR